MIHPPKTLVALDMDGVIFRTMMPKHDAMLSLFPVERAATVSKAILAMSGVPRRQKLVAVHRACFNEVPSDRVIEAYLAKYALSLKAILDSPVLTPGIRLFLEQLQLPAFVCSSAPNKEVLRMLESAHISMHFQDIYGAPVSKADALRQIVQKAGSKALVYFGDAVADKVAASEAAVAFIAVTGELDQFPDSGLPKIADFQNFRAVLDAINLVVGSNAA